MSEPEPKPPPHDESRRVMYHEAGHAVLGVHHQLAFLHVEVKDDDCGEVPIGVGPLENTTRAHSLAEIFRWQLFYAAGTAAELLVFGSRREYGAQCDRALHAKLERMRGAPRSNGWEMDIQSAVKVLDRESVEKIAKALERRKKLSVEQVYALLDRETPW